MCVAYNVMWMKDSEVIGIIIGEGCFQIALNERKNSKYNVLSRPMFHMDMKDEEQLVKQIKQHVGIGEVYVYENSNPPVVRWEIANLKQCRRLEGYINDNSGELWEASRKSTSFKLWCELRDNRKELHKTEEGMYELIEKVRKINPDGQSKKGWKEVVSKAAEER